MTIMNMCVTEKRVETSFYIILYDSHGGETGVCIIAVAYSMNTTALLA